MPKNNQLILRKIILSDLKIPLIWCAIFSCTINIILLAPPIFMMQVYDRVIPSQSIPTLQALVIISLIFYAAYGILESIRSRILSRAGNLINLKIGSTIFYFHHLKKQHTSDSNNNHWFKELENLRNFFCNGGPIPFFDIPWSPIYLIILFFISPYFGALGTAGVLLLILIAFITNRKTKPLQELSSSEGDKAISILESSKKNSELIEALGMIDRMLLRWSKFNDQVIKYSLIAADTISDFSGLSKFIRISMQSLILAIGAWLVIKEEVSSGAMIAASLLQARALAPIEHTIIRWTSFLSAKNSLYRILFTLSNSQKELEKTTSLPFPHRFLEVHALSIYFSNKEKPIANNINFKLEAGDILGIIGPSGSGKSTLARILVGVHKCSEGAVRLDGSTLDQWQLSDRGKFIGYLPQKSELLQGTIAQNISRFEYDICTEYVLEAAYNAGIDKLIRLLPKGYDTHVEHLSAGQCQRIGLACALYKNPFFVVLDEPNSSLDLEGEEMLTRAILKIRKRKGIVIIIAHRHKVLKSANKLLLLSTGRQQDFGSVTEVTNRLKSSMNKAV